jgi:hypothetical protein
MASAVRAYKGLLMIHTAEPPASNTEVEALKKALTNIEIKGSIYELLKPRFEIVVNPDQSVDLSARVTVPDVAGYMGIIDGLESRHPITPYLVGRYGRKPSELGRFIRAVLVRVLEHEIDESLFQGGNHVQAPKHWGPVIA